MLFPRLGVIGAGVIGAGVAQLFIQGGHEVILVDTDARRLAEAQREMVRNLRLFQMLQKSPGTRDNVDRLQPSVELAALAGVDFVIENVTEDWDVKTSVHRALDQVIGAAVPVGVNTSAIPVTRLASLHRHSERVIGMHFMNPAPLMPTVEIIRGACTTDATVVAATALVEQAGRAAIVVKDSPGFVTNRVMMLMVNEAIFLVHEGVSTVQDVDRLFKTCFGHKMGPLETADLIGLDTVLRSIEVIYEELNDSKYRPCPLLKKMVYAGWLGRKSNRGFYTYQNTAPTSPP
jgi:3-hydroxybutyryl-CoA dehydrogenase